MPSFLIYIPASLLSSPSRPIPGKIICLEVWVHPSFHFATSHTRCIPPLFSSQTGLWKLQVICRFRRHCSTGLPYGLKILYPFTMPKISLSQNLTQSVHWQTKRTKKGTTQSSQNYPTRKQHLQIIPRLHDPIEQRQKSIPQPSRHIEDYHLPWSITSSFSLSLLEETTLRECLTGSCLSPFMKTMLGQLLVLSSSTPSSTLHSWFKN